MAHFTSQLLQVCFNLTEALSVAVSDHILLQSLPSGDEMKPVPIFMALFVCVLVYLFVFQRDLLTGDAPDASKTMDVSVTAETANSLGVPVVVQRSVAQPVQSGLVLRGRTEAYRKLDVRSETTGIVISAPLSQGSVVAEGDILCSLDPGTRTASLTQARAQREEARLNEQAARTLAERGFSAATDAAARRAQLEAAQASVEQAEKELERLEIRAPFGGILETDTAELGTLLQPGSACGTIVDLSRIRFVGFVPEADIHRVELGAQAGARVLSGVENFGQIDFVSRSADALTKTFRVEFESVNWADLPDGATAEIGIALSGETAHFLPQAALTLDDTGQLGVRVVEDGVAQFRSIEIIRDEADGLWITGLADTAEVIVVGMEFVGNGSPVEITYLEDQS